MLSDPVTLLLDKISYMQEVLVNKNKNNNNYYFLLTNEKIGYIVISVTIPDLF